MRIEFSSKAYLALDQISDYLYKQSKSKKITASYIRKIRDFIVKIFTTFPKAGRSAEEFGEGVRKLVYQKYSILYKIVDREHIVILTLYRENLPDA